MEQVSHIGIGAWEDERMDLRALSDTKLQDANGETHRLGEYWEDKPVVLVFLRHFGCLLCREHASQLSEAYDDVQARGGDVVAIGTGDRRYAADFIAQEHIRFPVLVDDDAQAATAATIKRKDMLTLIFGPGSVKGMWRAHRSGHRVKKAGKRVNQLGATFVVGPGDEILYEYRDHDSGDHAPIPDVLAALRA
jgi:peroxiredoxin